MTDEYLLEKSLSKAKVPLVMELHSIAVKYEMSALIPRYERALMQSMNVATFFEVFRFNQETRGDFVNRLRCLSLVLHKKVQDSRIVRCICVLLFYLLCVIACNN